MKKYIIISFHYNYECCIVEAEDINIAYAKIIDYYGLPYPLDYNDVLNMTKNFDTKKFVDYFEEKENTTVYGLYELSKCIYTKEENDG